MPEPVIIADTGPLVAFVVARDEHHAWAVQEFRSLAAPFVTCEAVLAETFFLVHRHPGGREAFFALLADGAVVVNYQFTPDLTEVHRLIDKYRHLPMSLADACLVRLAEREPNCAVFTLDSHFRVYRRHGRQKIPVIMPPGR